MLNNSQPQTAPKRTRTRRLDGGVIGFRVSETLRDRIRIVSAVKGLSPSQYLTVAVARSLDRDQREMLIG